MLRIGILGCGIHGERYLRHLQRDLDEAKAAMFYRRDEEASRRLQREYSVPRAASAAALMESDEVDAILIATPPGNHLESLQHALSTGKPVLLEKPALARWSEAASLSEVDATRVMVAQTLRYNEVLRSIRARLSELGEIHRIRIAQRLQPSPLAWQRDDDVAGGGSVTLTGVHLFDVLRWYVGRTPDAVQCRSMRLLEHPLENAFDACFEYEEEAILAGTEVSTFGESRFAALELVGTRGQFFVDYMRGKAWSISGSDWMPIYERGSSPTLIRLLADFVRFARAEIASPITLQDGIETLRMAEACYRSHSQATRVLMKDLEKS